MAFHTPFHPFHPTQPFHPLRGRLVDAAGLETLNLALILGVAALVLLLGLL